MKSYKAVIIDDEPWTREVVKSLGKWEEYGISVAGEASDGEYGAELIRQVKPDIILTDVKMPQLGGIELVKLLRGEGNRTLVIFISGYDDYAFIRSALLLEAVDYLLKPVKPDELNGQLQHCLELLSNEERQETEVLEGGILDVPWAESYYTLRDALADSLNSSDSGIIGRKFDEIRMLIRENEHENLSKGNIVSIYYTLLQTVERFIISRGYTAGEVFGSRLSSFVFSSGSTPEDMLLFAERLFLNAAARVKELVRNRNRLDMNKIKIYAQEHFMEGLTLEQTAAVFYVSKEYLSKAFKAETGRGFAEYVTSLRMERARELILVYKIPIKEVGAMVGYMDQAHFYKAFKKYFGITPGEMREV